MAFGNWESSIHERDEQLKRITSAKRADTTPSCVDKIYKTGIFEGSGKTPYQTTLNSCTCADFARRTLPCKHIYRLAMELGKFEGSFDTGRNKNSLPEDILALPLDAQIALHEVCYENIYAQQRYCAYERNEIGSVLIANRFCKEVHVSVEVLGVFPVCEIKELLFSSDIEGLPKRTSIKRTFLKWLSENGDYAFPLLNNRYYFLELTEQAEQAKHTIYRRLSKKLYPSAAVEEDNIIYTIKL